MQHPGKFDGLDAVASLTHHLHIRLHGEQQRGTSAYEFLVFGDDDSNRRRRSRFTVDHVYLSTGIMRLSQHRLEVTLVTCYRASMGNVVSMIDPRYSLAARLMWLIIGLAFTFSIAAAVWVGSIARANVLEQHLRRLGLETHPRRSGLRSGAH